MNRTRVDIPVDAVESLDWLCGKSGEQRPGCVLRLIAMGVKQTELFLQRKKYQEVIDRWGEPTRRLVKH